MSLISIMRAALRAIALRNAIPGALSLWPGREMLNNTMTRRRTADTNQGEMP